MFRTIGLHMAVDSDGVGGKIASRKPRRAMQLISILSTCLWESFWKWAMDKSRLGEICDLYVILSRA